MTKIFKKPIIKISLAKKIIMALFFMALAGALFYFKPPIKTQAGPSINAMMKNPKLNQEEAILSKFLEGKETTPIIVNLVPTRAIPIDEFKDKFIRRQLEKEVKRLQKLVINKLKPDHVRITNRFTYIFGFSAEVTMEGLQVLLDDPHVLSIDDDPILYAHTNQGIALMNATTVRNTYNGAGLSIAICDTGIDYTHPQLGNGSFPNSKVLGGYDTGQNDSNPIDGNGHGTCCAGIAAGDLVSTGDYIGGVAYNAKLYALKITNTSTGGSALSSDMAEAWEWCVTHQDDDPDNPIMIISTSFGGGRYYSTCDSAYAAMTTAAANAKAAGITIFVSSGNDGYCDSIGWPACISHVVSVGAVYDASFGYYYPCISSDSCAPTKTYHATGCLPYSNYYAQDNTAADMVTSYSNTASFMILLAPANAAYTTDIVGSGGYSTGNYYSAFGGTSAACPYAAGSAACLQQTAMDTHGSYLSPDEVEGILVGTGDLITDGKVAITKPRIDLGTAINGVTLAAVSDFEVTTDEGRAIIQWQTSSENGTVGFFLLRQGKNERTYQRVNQSMLVGLLNSPQGGIYRLVDPGALTGETYLYKLVEIEANGQRRTHGPFQITLGKDVNTPYLTNRLPVKKYPMKGSYLRSGHEISPFKKARLKTMKNEMKTFRLSRFKRSKGEGKITIKENGLYLINQENIANLLGLTPFQARQMIIQQKLRLSNQGKEVAWLPAWNHTGIYFYGEGIDNPYTDENIYRLKKGQGLPMHIVKTGQAGAYSGQTFADSVHLEKDRYTLTALYHDPEEDYWLWDFVIGNDGSKLFDFNLQGVSSTGDPSLTILLKGASSTRHHVQVKLNDNEIGESSWQGTESHRFTLAFDQLLLQEGQNKIEVNGILDGDTPYSIFYIDSFDLKYGRYYRAQNDRLFCRGDNNATVTVEGFSSKDISVFEVSNPLKPVLISGATVDPFNRISFRPASPDALYLVIGKEAVAIPYAVDIDSPSRLKNKSQAADYVIIVPEGFENAAEELANLRRRNRLEPMVVSLEDIYDEFNEGMASPWAIKNFIAYAFNEWRGNTLKYVVLAGEGTYDYKDNLGYGENLIPPLMVNTPQGLFAAENRYGDVQGNDGIPEVSIGRLPVSTLEDFKSYIKKLAIYEEAGGEWTGKVIMAADNPDWGGDFPTDSERLSQIISGYGIEKIYLPQFLGVSQAREKLIQSINQGAALIHYMGHAGLDKLANEGILRLEDVTGLQNDNRLPVLAAMTCVAGRFSIPGFDTLSEALILKANGGIIAAWAPNGASSNYIARNLAGEFFNTIFQGGEKVLGQAILQALRNYGQKGGPKYMIDIYNLLGDPALMIK